MSVRFGSGGTSVHAVSQRQYRTLRHGDAFELIIGAELYSSVRNDPGNVRPVPSPKRQKTLPARTLSSTVDHRNTTPPAPEGCVARHLVGPRTVVGPLEHPLEHPSSPESPGPVRKTVLSEVSRVAHSKPGGGFSRGPWVQPLFC